MDSQQRCIAPISGYAPIIGFPQGWPPGKRQGIPGNMRWVNGALLKNKLFWRVRTLIVLLKLTRQTPEMHLWDLLDIGQSYVTVKIPDGWPCFHVYDISQRFFLFVIMSLYKAWDVVWGKRKSVIAGSFEEKTKKKNDISVVIVNEGILSEGKLVWIFCLISQGLSRFLFEYELCTVEISTPF